MELQWDPNPQNAQHGTPEACLSRLGTAVSYASGTHIEAFD